MRRVYKTNHGKFIIAKTNSVESELIDNFKKLCVDIESRLIHKIVS